MAPLVTPHDALFKAAFSDPARAVEELRHALGPEVSGLIDFSSLALESGSFVDEALRERHADILYSATVAGRRALIYVLFEHQSSDDPWMPLRLLIYLTRIWESALRGESKPPRIPAILPVVLHHSETGWRSATRFEALIDLPGDAGAIWEHVPKFSFALDDLAAVSAEALRHRAASAGTRLVLSALQQARMPGDFLTAFLGWVGLMRALRHEPDGARALRLVLRYIAQVRGLDDRRIIDILASDVGEEEAQTMQTLADFWRQEGELKGRQEGERKGRQEGERKGRQEGERKGRQEGERLGRQEGERAILIRQLRRRFGELPAAVLARIQAADEPSLERWSDGLLDARSLHELFPAA